MSQPRHNDAPPEPAGPKSIWDNDLPPGEAPPLPRWPMVLTVAAFAGWLVFLVAMLVIRIRYSG